MGNRKIAYRGTICCDIDGVLADFEGKVCDDFGVSNRHLWSLEDRYPNLDPELVGEYVKNPDNYIDLMPLFGGFLFCRQARGRGWYILLITSRDRSLREVTKSWLDKYLVPYDEIIFSRNKKEAIADYDAMNPSRPVKIVVDDSVTNLYTMPDKYCVAWQQPWNVGFYPRMYYDQHEMKIMLDTGERLDYVWQEIKGRTNEKTK